MATPAAVRAMAPAQLFMRWIPELLGNYPVALGQAAINIPLDMVGYLDLIMVHLKGTITTDAAITFNQLMPWNIITNFLIQPPGQTPPFRIGGQLLHAWNLIAPDFAPFKTAFGVPYSNRGTGAGAIDPINTTSIDVFPKANAAGQVVHLWYVLPAHRSSMDVRGVLPLGNRTRTNLSLSIAATADLVAAASVAHVTATALSVDVYQCYFTPPSVDSGAAVDPYWAVTYDQAQQVIAAVGAQAPIDIVPDDTILGIIHAVACNNVLDSTAIDTIALQVNESWLLGQQPLPFAAWEYIQNRTHAQVLPTGFIYYDLDDSVDDGLLDVKKWLHTDRVNKIRSYISIAAGATLGAGPAIFTSTRRLVDLNPAAHAAALG